MQEADRKSRSDVINGASSKRCRSRSSNKPYAKQPHFLEGIGRSARPSPS